MSRPKSLRRAGTINRIGQIGLYKPCSFSPCLLRCGAVWPSCSLRIQVMRRLVVAFCLAAAFLYAIPSAYAGVVVHIDKSRQRMTVAVDGKVRHSWAVSTGRRGLRHAERDLLPATAGAPVILAQI